MSYVAAAAAAAALLIFGVHDTLSPNNSSHFMRPTAYPYPLSYRNLGP